jgi:transcriptional regulator with XRE-family HTH domain
MTKKVLKHAKVARDSTQFKREGLSLGSRVRGLRNTKGWTLEEAGLHMNMDPKHLWKLERAYEGLNVTLVTLVRIAEAFELPVQSLFAYRGEVREPPPRLKRSGLKAFSRDPFTFVDAPRPDECWTVCIPRYDLNQWINSQRDLTPLTPLTWVRLEDQDQIALGRCFILLPPSLSTAKQKTYAIFEGAPPLHELEEGQVVLASHPRLSGDEEVSLARFSRLMTDAGALLRLDALYPEGGSVQGAAVEITQLRLFGRLVEYVEA